MINADDAWKISEENMEYFFNTEIETIETLIFDAAKRGETFIRHTELSDKLKDHFRMLGFKVEDIESVQVVNFSETGFMKQKLTKISWERKK